MKVKFNVSLKNSATLTTTYKLINLIVSQLSASDWKAIFSKTKNRLFRKVFQTVFFTIFLLSNGKTKVSNDEKLVFIDF